MTPTTLACPQGAPKPTRGEAHVPPRPPTTPGPAPSNPEAHSGFLYPFLLCHNHICDQHTGAAWKPHTERAGGANAGRRVADKKKCFVGKKVLEIFYLIRLKSKEKKKDLNAVQSSGLEPGMKNWGNLNKAYSLVNHIELMLSS